MCVFVCVIIFFIQCLFYHSVISTPSAHCTKWFSKQFCCTLRGGSNLVVTGSAGRKGSHITVCVNAYVTRMLPTSLCGMTHTACGQHISWCAAFYCPIRVRSKCACPETKACSSSKRYSRTLSWGRYWIEASGQLQTVADLPAILTTRQCVSVHCIDRHDALHTVHLDRIPVWIWNFQ